MTRQLSSAQHGYTGETSSMQAGTFTLQLTTESEPTNEQMVMYTKIDEVPCAGATCSMKKSVTATAATTYSKKPAANTMRLSASSDPHGVSLPLPLQRCCHCGFFVQCTEVVSKQTEQKVQSAAADRCLHKQHSAYLAALQAARLAPQTLLVSPRVHATR